MSEIRRVRRVLGRYLLADSIAAGGMATIHLGRLLGPVGFARTVAIKRLHPQFAKDPEFVASFLDEARLAARIQHPNVVQTLDVVAIEGELFLVMDYVVGQALSELQRRLKKRGDRVPPAIASAVVSGALYGLHAAHEAKSEDGTPLDIVHRDVSPHNLLVGVDGVPRVVDFGVAKAARRSKETEAGRIKGKLRYMSPEQAKSAPLDRRSDVFSTGIVLWEVLSGRRLFDDVDPYAILGQVLEAPIEPPSRLSPDLSPALDRVVMRALERDRELRFQSAREMAMALEDALPPALPRQVGDWVTSVVGEEIEQRGRALAELQREQSEDSPPLAISSALDGASDATADYQNSVLANAAPETSNEVTTPMPLERAPEPMSARPARRGWLLASASLLLLSSLALYFVVRGRSSPPAEPPRPSPAEATAEPSAPATPSGPPLSSSEPTPAVSVTRPTTARLPPPALTPSASKSKLGGNDCNPPFYVQDGIKHYKKHCRLE